MENWNKITKRVADAGCGARLGWGRVGGGCSSGKTSRDIRVHTRGLPCLPTIQISSRDRTPASPEMRVASVFLSFSVEKRRSVERSYGVNTCRASLVGCSVARVPLVCSPDKGIWKTFEDTNLFFAVWLPSPYALARHFFKCTLLCRGKEEGRGVSLERFSGAP